MPVKGHRKGALSTTADHGSRGRSCKQRSWQGRFWAARPPWAMGFPGAPGRTHRPLQCALGPKRRRAGSELQCSCREPRCTRGLLLRERKGTCTAPQSKLIRTGRMQPPGETPFPRRRSSAPCAYTPLSCVLTSVRTPILSDLHHPSPHQGLH